MECIALSPVHQIHQKYLRQQWMRFARSRSLVRAPAWFDCIKKPFFFNKPSAHSKNRCTYYCAMWFLERTNSVLFFASLCVLRGKIPHIKYLWFQQEWCDKVEKINNYAMLHSQHYHLCLCVCVNELSYSPFRIYLQLKPFIIMSLSTTARANQRKMDQTNGHQQNKVPTEEFFTRFFFFRFLCLSARHTRTTHRIHSLVLPRQKGKNILAACE